MHQDVHGKQLMCECLYLYGTMLLVLERHLPGPVREQMVVAVLRHQPDASLDKLEAVCKLVRATGYAGHGSPAANKPKDYPEKYFARFPIDAALTKAVVQCLQSDDIYQGAEAFPAPEHRSTRLATQVEKTPPRFKNKYVLFFCHMYSKNAGERFRFHSSDGV